MSAVSHEGGDAARSERAIRALTDASGASPQEIRDLFTGEFNRLERGAKVRSYLHVLAMASVRMMLSVSVTVPRPGSMPSQAGERR